MDDWRRYKKMSGKSSSMIVVKAGVPIIAALIIIAFAFITTSNTGITGQVILGASCGDIINNDTILNGNVACVTDALTINASITLDCNGYVISGAGAQTGIIINVTGATIKNCGIGDFSTGIKAENIGETTLINNSISGTYPLNFTNSNARIIYNNSYGSVEWNLQSPITTDDIVRADIAISYNNATVNPINLLNTTANITLKEITFPVGRALYSNGSGFTECADCKITRIDSTTYKFNVSHFSTYKLDSCGAVIDSSTTLAEGINCSGKNALTITGSGIALDCNNNLVKGTITINNSDNTLIKNCNVSDSDTALHYIDSSGNITATTFTNVQTYINATSSSERNITVESLSINRSRTYAEGAAQILFIWPATAVVKNNAGDKISGVELNITDNKSIEVFSGTTDSKGEISTTLIESIMKSSGLEIRTPHTFFASKLNRNTTATATINQSSTINMNIALTPPTISLDSPPNKVQVTARTIEFAYYGNDADNDNLTYTLYINGSAKVSNTKNKAETFTLDRGSYLWYVDVNDGLFTTRSDNRTLYIINQKSTTKREAFTTEELLRTAIKRMKLNTRPQTMTITPAMTIKFTLNNQEHSINIDSIKGDEIRLVINSEPIRINITKGETKDIDVNNNGIPDMRITIKNIFITQVTLELSLLKEVQESKKPTNEPALKTAPKKSVDVNASKITKTTKAAVNETPAAVTRPSENKSIIFWLIIAGIIILIGGTAAGFYVYNTISGAKTSVQSITIKSLITKEEALKEVTEEEYKKLYDYVKETLNKGFLDEKIIEVLKKRDWPEEVIKHILVEIRTGNLKAENR